MKKNIIVLLVAFAVGFAIAMSLMVVFREQIWQFVTQSAREDPNNLD